MNELNEDKAGVNKRGGSRVGAGRKKNSGAFKEQTVPIRVPVSLVGEVKALLEKAKLSANKDNE